ncbi:MAG: hypothetical protein Q9182_002920 [Xanthomendoza sp. 2 TL-2023]
MTDREHATVEDFHSYILVTGANGGLGYAICCRLIDEFILTRPNSHSLRLIITTRDKTKSHDTIAKLKDHIFRTRKHHKLHEKTPLVAKIYLQAEQVDLCQLPSVQTLVKRLIRSLPKLDTVILNAGHGGFTGVNYPLAVWSLLTDFRNAMTYPKFKLSGVGDLTDPQIPDKSPSTAKDSTRLGDVFCSNVFGHYMLVHGIAPLLSNAPEASGGGGRIIWISSLEAYPSTFSLTDLQGLSSPSAYESSKRLTDILALSSRLPTTRPYTTRFLPSHHVKQYLAHPGICATNILPVHWLLTYIVTAAFYIARWVGSPWHTVTTYKGACAPVWLALASQEELDAMEGGDGGAGKWGSGIDWRGNERATRTEVQGWGGGGGVRTGGDGEGFEVVGRRCWEAMEGLREEWEGLLLADE